MEITKSPEDKRQYRYLKLKNELKVLIVSDETTETSSATMRVSVGSYSDPKELPGLAHLLEHMLFLGTEEYPDEDLFERFLQENGGDTNAFTMEQSTHYYFDVNHSALSEALKRFSSFFKCPLLRSDSVEKEVNAVQSEYEMNLQSDSWKLQQLSNHLTAPDCVLNRFSIGNKSTLLEIPARLKIDSFKELRSFYEKHYSSNLMALCVLGRESLDELEDWVKKCFEAIENRNSTEFKPQIFPLKGDFLKKRVELQSSKKQTILHLHWITPPVLSQWETKPEFLVSHLIGHEGKGSLFNHLRDRGWATSLAAFSYLDNEGIFVQEIKIKLTELGLREIDSILKAVFEFIELLRNMSEEEWKGIYEDLAEIERINFLYKNKESPSSYTQEMVTNLHRYPPEEVLVAPYSLKRFDLIAVKKFLAKMSLENFRYFVSSGTKLEGESVQKEPYFNVNYKVKAIPTELHEALKQPERHADFKVPQRNRFIAKDFSLKNRGEDEREWPEVLKRSEMMECFFRADTKFKKPHTILLLFIETPESYSTPQKEIMARLYCRYFDLSLKTELYDAELAGIGYKISFSADGITLELKGFSQKIPKLLEEVLEWFKTAIVDERLFDLAMESVRNDLNNSKVAPAYKRAGKLLSWLTEEIYWLDRDLANIKGIKKETLQLYFDEIFEIVNCKVHISGNLVRSSAMTLCDTIESFLEEKKSTLLRRSESVANRCLKIPLRESKPLLYLEETSNPKEPNSCVVLSFQMGMARDELHLLTRLVNEISGEQIYSQLRTKENLGYLVYSWSSQINNASFFKILVQGIFSPLFVYQRVMKTLEKIHDDAVKFSQEKFEKFRESLVNKIKEKDQNLTEEMRRHWNEIRKGFYRFDRKRIQSEKAEAITHKELLRFFQENILGDGARVIVSAVVNSKTAKNLKKSDELDFNIIKNVGRFKKCCELMPASFVEVK